MRERRDRLSLDDGARRPLGEFGYVITQLMSTSKNWITDAAFYATTTHSPMTVRSEPSSKLVSGTHNRAIDWEFLWRLTVSLAVIKYRPKSVWPLGLVSTLTAPIDMYFVVIASTISSRVICFISDAIIHPSRGS